MMMKPNDVLYGTILLLLLAAVKLQAQVYQSYKSETSFFSKAPLEDIEAHNDGGASVLNTGTQEIVFVIPIRGFEFRKSLDRKSTRLELQSLMRISYAVFCWKK